MYPATTQVDARPVVIEIRHLSKVFRTRTGGTLEALQNVDIDVRFGEFVCVVGPSGCGKTTLLNILGELEPKTAGAVRFDFPASERPLLSIVFQEQGVFPWLTVLDNAAFGLMARGVGRKERGARAREVLDRVGLSRFLHAYPRELSGGMKQRVNLARAFANDPDLLLMDEPFAAVDEHTKLILQDGLLHMWEGSRKTVVFITHSIEEAIRLADRIVVMSARPGRVKAEIPVNIPRPRNVYELQTSPEFLRVRGLVWEALKEEVLALAEREAAGEAYASALSRQQSGAPMASTTPEPTAPEPTRADHFGWLTLERVFTVVSPMLLLVVWEGLSRAGVLDVRIFSRPTLVAGLLWSLALDGSLWKNASATLARLVIGMVVGVVPGLFLGLTMGLFRMPRAIINPLISATYALPRIALFPLVLLIVGLNETSNIIMIALGPFFIMTISAMAAVLNVDRIYLRVAKSFKISTRDMYTQVVLPAAMPIILSGFKLSLGLGLLGVVSVEFLLANEGLGYMIWHSWQILSLGESMAGLLVTGIFGYLMFLGIDRLERALVPWAGPQN